jgi:hypothetical protein
VALAGSALTPGWFSIVLSDGYSNAGNLISGSFCCSRGPVGAPRDRTESTTVGAAGSSPPQALVHRLHPR